MTIQIVLISCNCFVEAAKTVSEYDYAKTVHFQSISPERSVVLHKFRSLLDLGEPELKKELSLKAG